ncbi:MAG: amino acid adenylation domain-containing protein [Acidobacteriota bacterium]
MSVLEGHGAVAPPTVSEIYVFPASFAQQRMWFLDHLERGTPGGVPVYIIPRAGRIRAPLDAAVFERALSAMVQRHETLRTSFRVEAGEPVQVVALEGQAGLQFVDLSSLREEDRDREARRLSHANSREPFDLGKGPLFRATLVRLGPDDHLFLMAIHHIISDGWSLGILFGELAQLYDAFSRGEPSPLPPLPIQYADYAAWQREWMTGGRLEEELSYWRGVLGGSPALLDLPTDRPRPPVQSFRGSQVSATIPPALTDSLRKLSRREGVTLFMSLLAAFQTLLFRSSGQEDVVVGSPIAGRGRTETEGLIGLFVNTLALRTDLSGDPTFHELLRRVREVTIGAYSHQDVPFERIVEELRPRRSLSHGPIVQVFFALENTPRHPWHLPGLTLSDIDLETDVARADLTIFMTDKGDSLPYQLEFNSDIFDEESVRDLASRFEALLAAAVADPLQRISRLRVLTASERERILAGSKAPEGRPAPAVTIPQLFEEVARTSGHKRALVCAGSSLTYEELNGRANSLAHALRERGVGPGTLVAMCVTRSVEMVVGILGILKAGGGYVPIDPLYPRERVSYLLEDSGARLLLTERDVAPGLDAPGCEIVLLDDDWPDIAHRSTANPAAAAGPEDVAYAIYTSGSTGRPKGVLVRHAGVANLFAATRRQLGFDESDVWTMFHSYAFDLSVWELWGPLLHGGRLVMVPVEIAQSPLDFSRLLAEESVSVVSQTPAAARRLAAVRQDPASGSDRWRLRHVICGGEALPGDLAADLLGWNVPVWNFYGPTEATVWTTIKRVTPADCGPSVVSIGRPIENTAAYVLDRHREPVPHGVPGDLYLGGAGLARGYLGRPELNRERFVADPFAAVPAARLYRTGDRARRLRSGDIEFLGRDDHQVKVRGYRVELGEIETALADHPEVREAAVLLREDQPGSQQLVAYYVAGAGETPGASALRAFLLTRLPEYMVPQSFVPLEALPLTSNAKLDRRALPAPDGTRPELEKAFVAPRTSTEEKIAEIWRRLLAVDRVGVEDDFFELGGHSLKATQAVSRIKELFAVDLPLRRLFETPTVAALARRVDELSSGHTSDSRPPLERVERDRPLRLSFGQQRLWFLDRLEPGGSAYNVGRAMRIRGALDRAALRASLEAISLRHESLRTMFIDVDGEPFQVISPNADLSFREESLAGRNDTDVESRIAGAITEESLKPFDLSRGPLWRVLLLQISADEHILLLTIHHIASDGWSFGVLFEELASFYSSFHAGKPTKLPELRIQYADYAHWQRTVLEGPNLQRLVDYWRGALAGAPEVLVLSEARLRPQKATSRGAFLTRAFPAELTREVESLSLEEGVTPFTTLISAFQAFLSRDARERNVVVGTDVANRDRIETESLIGFFVNLLPIRTDLPGNPSFRELLRRTKEAALSAYAHQELPFEKLVEELRPVRVPGANPLVQVLIVQVNRGEALRLPGLVVERYPLPAESSRFDLVLYVNQHQTEIVTNWLYSVDLFDREAVERLAARFEKLLNRIVKDPDARLERLEALMSEEKMPNAAGSEAPPKSPRPGLRGARRQGVDIARVGEVVEETLAPEQQTPLVLRPEKAADLELAEWARTRKDELETKLLRHGALLFRGFGVSSAGQFEGFASGLCRGELFGEYGDLPREAVGGRVYGSTPYPSDQAILFHNESSHMHRWPMKIWFYCVIAAKVGGETPIADCRKVYRTLDPALAKKFHEKGLLYSRNYGDGLDVSWESFYGTNDRRRVEELCRKAGTEFEWRGENGLRTLQKSPAVIRHPQTGELSFFNQLQLHHVSCLDPAVRESLLSLMKETDLPRNVYYGDGSPIEDSVMNEVGEIYRSTSVAFPWEPGDVVMLNNMLVAHSRNPYEGPRKIVVAMGEMIDQSEVPA